MTVQHKTNLTSTNPPKPIHPLALVQVLSESPTGFETREIISNPGDERVHVSNATGMPYLGLCLLKSFSYNEDGTLRVEIFATGWFSSPRTLVTAGHNLFNPIVFGSARSGWADTVHAYPAYNGENSPPYGGFEQAEQLYVPSAYQQQLDIRLDIGIVRFEQPISAENAFLNHEVKSDGELKSSQALIAGYPLDLGGGLLMYEGYDRFKAFEPERLFYELDTGKGQSGAPVIVIDGGNQGTVVGIHAHNSSQTPTAYYPANSATRITPTISAWIQQYK